MDKIIMIAIVLIAVTGWFVLQDKDASLKQSYDHITITDNGLVQVDQERYVIRYSKEITQEEAGPTTYFGEIKLFVEDNEMQTVDHFAGRGNAFVALADHQELITNADVDFDGINDLGIISGVGYGGVNYVYDFYVFNDETNRLEQDSLLSNITNPTFSRDGTQITTQAKNGPVTCTYNYAYTDSVWERSLVEEDFVDADGNTVSTLSYCSAF